MRRFEDWEIDLLRAMSGPLPLDGTIRRFGARVDHHSLGYTANGMSVWDIAGEDVEAAAQFMTGLPEVSHCYLRPRHPGWDYNLYAMIHGKCEADVRKAAAGFG